MAHCFQDLEVGRKANDLDYFPTKKGRCLYYSDWGQSRKVSTHRVFSVGNRKTVSCAAVVRGVYY
jgi:hypothetical protein